MSTNRCQLLFFSHFFFHLTPSYMLTVIPPIWSQAIKLAHSSSCNKICFFCSSLIGHEATIFLSCFTSDSSLVVTGCHNGVLKLWPSYVATDDSNAVHCDSSKNAGACDFSKNVKPFDSIREAHDMGITCGECSPTLGQLMLNKMQWGSNNQTPKIRIHLY